MKLPAVLALVLAGCTNVYVQTGNGVLERTVDIERSPRVGRSTTTVQPKEKENGASTDHGTDVQR